GHLRAERRLGHGQLDRREDVVALAHEARVGPNTNQDVDVAGAAAEHARVAFARDADPLPVVDAGRDLHLDRTLVERAPRALALLAELLDSLSRTGTGGAGLGADELAEDAARDLPQPAGAAARRTRSDGAARLGARAAAVLARDCDGERNLASDPACRLAELDRDLCGDIGAARVPRRRSAEQVVAEEG